MSLLNSSFENMNEIVFENRNKLYGAYVIRKSYNERVLTSLLFALSAILLLLTIPYIVRLYNGTETLKTPLIDTKWVSVEYTIEKLKPVETPQKETKSSAPQKPVTDKALTANVRVTDAKTIENATPPIIDNSAKPTNNPVDNDSGKTGTGKENNTTPTFDSTGYYANRAAVTDVEVDVKPEFPGGENALPNYIRDHVHFPEIAKENNISGTVVISFIIDQNGNIVDVNPERKVGGGCTEIAKKAVSDMPKWKPGKYKGHPVKVKMYLPISFKLK